MRLTPERVEKLLDRWDQATAPRRERGFTEYLVIGVVITVVALAVRAWWFVLCGLALTLVMLRLLWELPGSRVRRSFEAIRRRRG
jgi:hypothetical protein